MRFLWVLPLCVAACRSDPPAGTGTPAPSASASVTPLDTTPLPGAPALSAIGGFWIVESEFKPAVDEPGTRPGNTWWFGADTTRLLVGDASDKRPIIGTKVEGDALRIDLEGTTILITRRKGGIALRHEADTTRVPLRRATPAELSAIAAADKKHGRMLERACEKAVECCQAALAKGVAKQGDCTPLLGKPDMSACIQSIALFKNKAATANITVPECLPDK